MSLALALVAGACSVSAAAPSDGGSGATTEATSSPTSNVPPVTLTPSVAEDASVPVDTVVSVRATNGTVTDVRMTYDDAKGTTATVPGTIAADSTTWTANALLEPGTAYALTMTGQNAEGVASSATSGFTTQKLSKKQEIYPVIVGDGTTVGVAMPVVVTFDVPVTDKASFEKNLTVTSTRPRSGPGPGSATARCTGGPRSTGNRARR